MTKSSADSFGFDNETLPEPLESLVTHLEEAAGDPHAIGKKRRKTKISPYRSEALHYWREACEQQFESPNSFIAHAIDAFRQRYRDELGDPEENPDEPDDLV